MHGFRGAALAAAVLAAVFVNGWTDAPTAIASAVGTRAIPFRKAVWLAAVCNLAGLLVMGLASAPVADTVLSLADFGGTDPAQWQMALCAAMAAIILFAVAAWYFGIPSSESHALLAALAGAGIAIGHGSLSWGAWSKVLLGLGLSLGAGYLCAHGLAWVLGPALAKAGERGLGMLQVLAAAAMAFLHGAQDGQKFAAVLIASAWMAKGLPASGKINPAEHIPAFVLCAVAMAMGTAVGGRRIVETVGIKMVSLRRYQGLCADLGAGLCLLLASLAGVPISTTHTKTAAILGAGTAEKGKAANRSIVRGMLAAWAFTFPVCGALGYVLTAVFVRLAG